MQRTTHQTLAAAIGAFVGGEMAACMVTPTAMELRGPDDAGEKADYAVEEFDLHAFEKHLRGLLSDLVYLCTWPVNVGAAWREFDAQTHEGTFVLVIATKEQAEAAPPAEWQQCAQGYACIEALPPA